MKKLTVGEIMLLNNIMHKLMQMQIEYPIDVAYKLHKIKNEFDDIETLLLSRWKVLLGTDFDLSKMTEEQQQIYSATTIAEVEIDTYGLTLSDVLDNHKVKLSLKEMERLTKFLK